METFKSPIDDKELARIVSTFKSQQEVDLFLQAMEEMVGIGKSKTADGLLATDYIEKPVDMETFLSKPYYLGIIDSLFPKIVDDLLELFDPSSEYYLVLLGGSIGWGKSTMAEVCMARVLYEVSCLKNPQATYRMVEGDKLFFANVSVTHTQAKRVVFEGLKGKIKRSEYFRSVFPFEDFSSELRFPNNVLVAAATQSQVLGMNTFAAAMDEANFMPIVESSVQARLRGRKTYDQAEVVFTALIRRMETRYQKMGNLPGKLFALSSAQYPDDFMERKAALYRNHPHTFVRNYAVWDTKPADTYSGNKFIVIFNKESGMGRVAKENEKGADEEESLAIPIEFLHDFEVDMEGSLRDLAGKATLAIEPFITRRDKIMAMCDPLRRHPYSLYETTLRDGGYVLKDLMSQFVKEVDDKGQVTFEGWRPIVNPKSKRMIHIDPGISGDACGFCMGHISHFEERLRVRVVQVIDQVHGGEKRLTRETYKEILPIIYVDMWLRIVPPPGGEIILNDVRELIYDLREIGFRIGLITMDSYQSKDTEQMLKAKKYNVDELSVDADMEPYNRLRLALYESRVLAYMHDVGVLELKRLEKNKKKNKVDHPPKGSKDMADALAGVVHNCETRRVVEPIAPSLGELESPVMDEQKRRIDEMNWLMGRKP